VHFDKRAMNDIPPHRRNTALVFQGYALWPHMTVEQNVEYGLRVRGLSATERRERVAAILDVVHLSDLGHRYPSELSGGQQQRVALARAIVVEPDVLLFDEPLSNLDARLRVEMRREILRIQKQTGITSIYVTHDQKEALSMGERIAILDRGRIEQTGRPEECYRRPRTQFVAGFLGDANFVDGRVADVGGDGTCRVETPLGRLVVQPPPSGEKADAPSVGQNVVCCFRPESLQVADEGESEQPNRFRARIVRSTYLGETVEYDLSAAEGALDLRATSTGRGDPAVAGGEIDVFVAPADVVLL
jgi:iron(III) transport system ATP-binding protein